MSEQHPQVFYKVGILKNFAKFTGKHQPRSLLMKLWDEGLKLTILLKKRLRHNIVTRNNIVWKLAHGYCLCYCKTFLLVPDSTECTETFLPKSGVHYLYQLKSNKVIGQK